MFGEILYLRVEEVELAMEDREVPQDLEVRLVNLEVQKEWYGV